MTRSKVYFTNMRTTFTTSLLRKLSILMDKAGINSIDFNHKFAAIKMHFGEPGNLAFLRPNYAKVVADKVKELGGLPFLTDCNTLYVGGRKNALDHLDSAMLNGFSPLSTGCQIIIGDGLKGTDDVEVPVNGGELCKTARIGRVIMDADIIISLSHFKGHELAGFGGAIKNIGMGCGSRAGKKDQHSDGKPHVRQKACVGCGSCARICAHGAPTKNADGKMTIDKDKCAGCGRCIGICPFDAIVPDFDGSVEMLNKKMAEYTKAVIDGRPHFHIAVITDVSPYCDCHPENDAPIVPNLGIAVSFDPVALDRACADIVNAAPVLANSVLADNIQSSPNECKGHDHFHNTTAITNWQGCLDHAEKIGIGTQNYELITLDIK